MKKTETPETAPGADTRASAATDVAEDTSIICEAGAKRNPPEVDFDHIRTMDLLCSQQAQLLKAVDELSARQAAPTSRPRKDVFDMVAAFAPILSGAIIALGGAYFTTIYNQQQLKLQEIQTIEKFIPHLVGDEKSKKAAILAISSLTDAKLASKIASIYASKGTVSALEQIVQQSSQGDRKVASTALARALDTMAESYDEEKRYDEAIAAYKRALQVREQSYGPSSPMLVSSLTRLAKLYQAHGDARLAESVLKRVQEIQKKNFGLQSAEYLAALKHLQQLYADQGNLTDSQSIEQEITSTEAQLKAAGKSQGPTPVQSDEPGEGEPQPDLQTAGVDSAFAGSAPPDAAQPESDPAKAEVKSGEPDRTRAGEFRSGSIDRPRGDAARPQPVEKNRTDGARGAIPDAEPQPALSDR